MNTAPKTYFNQQGFTLPVLAIVAIVGVAIAFFLGMEYKAYQIRSVVQEAFNTTSKPQSIVKEAEKQKSEIIKKGIGDEIEMTTLKFKVNKVEEKQTLSGGDYGTPKVAKEGTKFVIIDLNVTNMTDTKFSFNPDDGFRLVDNKNREFTASSMGVVDLYYRGLSPSITENGIVVYEIPQDAESYDIMSVKAGTNQVYRVVLK